MAICDFCLANVFQQNWRSDRPKQDHHANFYGWKDSVLNSCMICTLLLEHIRTAVQGLEGENAERKRATPGEAADKEIRTTTSEELLVDWLPRMEDRLEVLFPLYTTRIKDAGGREAWRVRFQPVDESLKCDGRDTALPTQDFLVYATDYDADVVPKRALLGSSTGNDQTISQIKAWDEHCRKNHAACKKIHRERLENEWVPRRLIYVGHDEPSPRLIETGGRVSDKFRQYVTLSYTWGYAPEPANLLTHDNYDQQLFHMDMERMPKTFQDAISTTQKLGIEYLWIDAFCLLQQDTDEWLRESPLMHEVYGNATLNLAAVSGTNNQQGLYRKRSIEGLPPMLVSVPWAGCSLNCLVVREDFWQGEILSEPLYQRGWCL